MIRINTELTLFDSVLARKPQLVVVNKVDLPQVQARLAEIRSAFSSADTTIFFVSAATGGGVAEAMSATMKLLQSVSAKEGAGKEIPGKVFRPQPKGVGASVYRDGDTLVVVAPALERIVARTRVTSPGVRWQLQQQLRRLGISKVLERAGVKPGDRVRCGDIEWEW